MEVIEISGHNDICGGYSYEYEVKYTGRTLKEVLAEIKEFTNNDPRFCRINDFGHNENGSCDCWGIYVNRDIYLSAWNGQTPEYKGKSHHSFYEGDESELVKSVSGHGGWYSGINFYITV